MRVLVTLLLALLLQLGSLGYGTAFQSLQSYLLFISKQTSRRHSHRATSPAPARLFLAPSEPPRMWIPRHMGPAPAPALAPRFPASAPRPSRRDHWRHPHAYPPSSFYPPPGPECRITCPDPLTTTPLGSPCGCVLPMRVELDLGVAPFRVFSVVIELLTEVAAGTYMKQSQVRIIGAAASDQDQSKTRVDIDLVPLGEKFDNMTALLIYERFRQKKVAINASIFGDYDVISLRYPGLPDSPLSGASGPGGTDSYPNPFVANVPPSKNKSLNARMIVIIALSSFILILTSMAIACICVKWRRLTRSSTTVGPGLTPSVAKRSGFRSMISSSLASSASISLVSTMGAYPPSVKTFSLLELEKATDKFSSKRVLGEGGFGRVYHGTMEDGTHAAIKLLTREDHSGDREFIAEVVMLSRLHHRNLVKLIGICIEGRTRCLVYELVHNGSVESHLHGADRASGPLDWDTRLKISLGAARGLAYLHEDSNPRVIHRDFKGSNVLLENDFTPKVSDFGLAREASEGIQHISTRVMGTFGYVAPEYAMTGHLLVKSDVYSYGVVLLELLSGRKPVDNSQPHGQENLVTWARPLLTSTEGLQQLVDPSLDGDYDFDNMAKVAAIASMCVHPEVSQRPFMGEVVQALKLIYNDMDETFNDVYSQREGSSVPDCDFRGETGETGTDSSWWNGGTPHLAYGCTSSFMTMEYSSGLVEEMDRRRHSTPTLFARGEPLVRQNRSGPLQTKRHKSSLAKLRGSMSEHELLSRRFGVDGYWA